MMRLGNTILKLANPAQAGMGQTTEKLLPECLRYIFLVSFSHFGEFGNRRSRVGRHQKKLASQPHLRYLLTQD
jgi:hypothetical protein